MATTTQPSPAQLTMKLLVDSSPARRRRVVFAEAGKDTVDFLFSLLAVPAGTAVRLLSKDDQSMPGSMGNLYSSAEKLADGPYAHPAAARDAVLCAAMPSPAAVAGPPTSWLFRLPEPQPPPPAPAAPKKFFNCSTGYANCRGYVTEVRGTRCPNCNNQMLTEAKIVGSSPPPAVAQGQGAVGFVQGGMVTYTVTDDLVISPMSNVSTIALLNACAVRDFGSLQERVVQIGYKEVLVHQSSPSPPVVARLLVPCTPKLMWIYAICRAWRSSGLRCSPRPCSLMFSSARIIQSRPP